MPDPVSIPLADIVSSFSSVVVLLFLGAMCLVLWQLAILLGAMIADLFRREGPEKVGHLEVG
jgi:hypothetical protein